MSSRPGGTGVADDEVDRQLALARVAPLRHDADCLSTGRERVRKISAAIGVMEIAEEQLMPPGGQTRQRRFGANADRALSAPDRRRLRKVGARQLKANERPVHF